MSAPEDKPAPPAVPEKPCPVCRRPAHAPYRPFCSKRCADIDLNRWLGGVYAIPVGPDENDPIPEDGSDE